MAVDVILPNESICLINVYHNVPEKGHALHALLDTDIDDTIPTLMFGDFNTHSLLWSLPSTTLSPWASALEIWFTNQGLHLLNPPDIPTWRSRDNQRPSILDLALCNDAALFSDQFLPILISFEDSLGSDHAAITTSWIPTYVLPNTEESDMVGFSIVDKLRETWCKEFLKLHPPPITDISSLEAAATALHEDIDRASTSVFRWKKAPDPRGVRWWNQECSAALTIVLTSHGAE